MCRLGEMVIAYLLDLILGEPRGIPHPVVGIGRFISFLENILYPKTTTRTPRGEVLRGGLLVVIVLFSVYLVSRGILYLLGILHPYLEFFFSIWFLFTTIAAKGLSQAAGDVYQPLVQGNLSEARLALSKIVGRDTYHLSEKEIVRGAVETVAENIVDGVTAPLFYAFLGGAPLALLYKAVNTMDSMLGYKSDRYLYFGRIAALIDDIFNYLPARITFVLILILRKAKGKKNSGSWWFLWQEAKKHPSPNSGFSEAAVAGFLGVRLGGLNFYQGKPSLRAYMGKPLFCLNPIHIQETVKVMYAVELIFLLGGGLIWSCWRLLFF